MLARPGQAGQVVAPRPKAAPPRGARPRRRRRLLTRGARESRGASRAGCQVTCRRRPASRHRPPPQCSAHHSDSGSGGGVQRQMPTRQRPWRPPPRVPHPRPPLCAQRQRGAAGAGQSSPPATRERARGRQTDRSRQQASSQCARPGLPPTSTGARLPSSSRPRHRATCQAPPRWRPPARGPLRISRARRAPAPPHSPPGTTRHGARARPACRHLRSAAGTSTHLPGHRRGSGGPATSCPPAHPRR
mmetsp:Transcript_23360/g.63343  ORF Transcript_23360/g.63343 Transcript_23360/m.63343 type:complete len:246 (+) Transcript_23360:768-1505(+)